MLAFVADVAREAWIVLEMSAVYVLVGILAAGMIKVFLPEEAVARHLGRGKVASVLKAALFGIPLPLCSCGVLPAAAALRKQGATRGATSAFLVATPESGVDSIAITYALLGPLMAVARPVAAFVAAVTAGLLENLAGPPEQAARAKTPQPGGCCEAPAGSEAGSCGCGDEEPGADACADEESPASPAGWGRRLGQGIAYAVGPVWGDIAGWFLLGLLLAGLIAALLPADLAATWLGGGLGSMLAMVLVGIPLYICATSSTPIAAALILKGVSPGAALVFLLVGPATNIATITVLLGILGRRSTAIYLGAIAAVAVAAGLALDAIHAAAGLSATALAGDAAELLPSWLERAAALLLLALSLRPALSGLRRRARRLVARFRPAPDPGDEACGCSGST